MPAPKTFRRLCAFAAFFALLSPAALLRAEDYMDGDVNMSTDALDLEAADGSVMTTAATPAALAPVQYTGRIRQYPAATGTTAMTNGALTLLLSPTGKVTGTITWSGATTPVDVTGKYDVASGQGRFVVRDAGGTVAAGALRMPFHVSKNGVGITGGGMTTSGETSGFRLYKQSADTGSSAGGSVSSGTLSLGGATLTFAGSNTYTGSSALTTINTLPVGSGSTAVNFGGATTIGNTAILTGTGTLNIGGSLSSTTSGIVMISSGYALTFGGGATVSMGTGGLAVVTPAAGEKLTFISSTVGSSTSAVGGTGAVTISGSAMATVVGGATVSVGAGTVTLTPTVGGTVTVTPAGS